MSMLLHHECFNFYAAKYWSSEVHSVTHSHSQSHTSNKRHVTIIVLKRTKEKRGQQQCPVVTLCS